MYNDVYISSISVYPEFRGRNAILLYAMAVPSEYRRSTKIVMDQLLERFKLETALIPNVTKGFDVFFPINGSEKSLVWPKEAKRLMRKEGIRWEM